MTTYQEIATAYVSIVPTLKGVTGNLAKEFAGVTKLADSAGGNVSKSMSGAFESATKMAQGTRKAVSNVATEAGNAAKNFARGFQTGDVDGFSAALGNLGRIGTQSIGNVAKAIPGVSQGLDVVRNAAMKVPQAFSQFTAGFQSSTAAASSFTGVMGTLGGQTRAALDGVVSKAAGLGQSITQPARNFVDGFRAMTGGANDFSGTMGNIGATAGKLLGPVIDVGKNIGGAFKQAGEALAPALEGIKEFASSAVDIIKEIPGRIADVLRGPATAAVAAAGVAMGVALTKGLGRLNAIDGAQAKLRGLGHDAASTSQIMDNSLAAVKGTAFGLDEAATTAAGAVAAGIQPGKELEDTLTTVANVAAATGRGMDDMGAVFNQVAAGGKAYTMQIKQVADAGLPIWQKLGEELGVTTDEVQKMASSGQIDFATFERAASEAAGNVAFEMGQTLPGSLDNLGAAIGRIGANLWGGEMLDDGGYSGIYGQLAELAQAATNALGPIEDMAKNLGSLIGDKLAPVIDWVVEKLNAFGDAGDSVGSKFGPLLSVLGPATAAFGAFGAGGLAPLLEGLPVVGNLLGPFPEMLGKIGGPAGIAAAGLIALAHVDPTDMAAGFDQIAEQLPEMILGLTDTIVDFATDVFPTFVETLVENLPILLEGVLQTVDAVIGALVEALPVLIEGAITLFMGLVEALAEIIPPLVESVVELVPTIIESLLSMLPALIEGAVQLFTAIIEALPIIIPPLITAVVDLIPVIVDALLSVLPALLDGAVLLFTSLIEALPIILPALLEALWELGPEMVGALLDLVPQLIEAGVDLLKGLAQGLIDGVSNVLGAIKDVGGKIVDGFKGFFGISSPSTLMAEMGGFLDDGLATGVTDGMAAVASVEEMSARIMGPVDALKAQFTALSGVVASQVAAIMGSIQRLIGLMSGQFRSRVSGELQAVAKAFQTILPRAVQAAVNAMRQGLTSFAGWMGAGFRAAMTQALLAVVAAFTKMQVSVNVSLTATRAGLQGFSAWTGGQFRSSLVTAVNAIRDAFVAVPRSVTTAWAGMRSGTARPTNFVISTVYMQGIRAAVNAISNAVGTSVRMPAVSGVSYARGTADMVLPGYSPGIDNYTFYNPALGFLRLGGGEAILRPEVTRALGGAPTINAWNNSRGRGVGKIGDRGYAKGGIIDFLRTGASGAWSVATSGMDFVFKALADPKKTIQDLVVGPARSSVAGVTGGEWGEKSGLAMVKIAGEMPGIFAKEAAKMGLQGLPGAAAKALGVPYVWGGSSIPPGVDCSGLVYWAANQLGHGLPRLTAAGYQRSAMPVSQPRPGDLAFWGNPASHVAIMTGPGRMIHAPKPGDVVREAALYGNPTFGRLLFDEGGWLMPGLNFVENKTGRPEPVFTGNEFDQLLGGRGIGTVNINMDVSELEDVQSVTDFAKRLGVKLMMAGAG